MKILSFVAVAVLLNILTLSNGQAAGPTIIQELDKPGHLTLKTNSNCLMKANLMSANRVVLSFSPSCAGAISKVPLFYVCNDDYICQSQNDEKERITATYSLTADSGEILLKKQMVLSTTIMDVEVFNFKR